MYTSAECRAQAEEKLAQAEHDNQHRNRLITTAEAWLFLASQLRRIERSFVPKRHSRRTDYRKETMMTKKEVLLLKRCARAQFCVRHPTSKEARASIVHCWLEVI